jgi:uncharacterized protein with HEPN domain
MSRDDFFRVPDFLDHIIEAIDRIHVYVEDMSETDFLADDKTRDAVVRNFEIIGEAARNVERHHADFAEQHPEIPWALMYAMRNRVAHGYFQVDYEMVWKSIHMDLPPLRDSVRGLLDSFV